MVWISLARQLIPIQTAHSLSPSWMRKRVERIIVRKFVFWDKGSLIIKAILCTSKVKQWINLLLCIDRQVFSHLRRAGLYRACWWLGKANAITTNVSSSSFSQLLLLSTTPYGVNIPMVSWGHLSPLCLLPTSCALLALSGETVLWNHWSEWLKHPSVLSNFDHKSEA